MERLLQLFIGSERIDLFKDETISITQTLQNVRDIDKIFTSFTKTFSVPASKTNNKIFKHYYNFDVQNGFDARLKVNATLEINSLPFKRGKIKLEGVDLKDRKPHTYRITFFGNTVELKDLLGDDKLNDLQFNGYNLLYGANTVKGRLTQAASSTRHVIAPLITHTQRLYFDSGENEADSGNLKWNAGTAKGVKWNQLKYAIRVNKIIEEIEARYTQPNYPINLSFSSDFFKSTGKTQLNNLFMWLHRKSGPVENLGGTQELTTLVDGWNNYQNGDYGVNMNGTFLSIFYQPQIVNTFQLVVTPAVNFNTQEYSVRIANGIDGNWYNSGTITGQLTVDMTTANPLYPVFGNAFDYSVFITTSGGMTFSSIRWLLNFEQQGDPQLIQTLNTFTFSTATVFQFNINQQIPDMKVIEFLTGLFKMFNLTAFIDESVSDDDNSVIKVIPLDEYYAEGKGAIGTNTEPWDISEFVDSTKHKVDVALPYRRIVFKYKDTKTFLANRFNQLANRNWGEIDYSTGESELAGKLYKIEAPFSHMLFERLSDANLSGSSAIKDIQWGYSVSESQNAYKGAPLLFYPVRVNTGGISFVDDVNEDTGAADNHVQISYVNLPSNSVQMPGGSTPSDTNNINFNNEINEWTGNTEFTGTLFNNFYNDYISDIFKTNKRLTKVTAYLPLNILLNFNLNDVFVINERRYLINEITTDLLTGKSDIELLNIV
jgi:hypothetical protein